LWCATAFRFSQASRAASCRPSCCLASLPCCCSADRSAAASPAAVAAGSDGAARTNAEEEPGAPHVVAADAAAVVPDVLRAAADAVAVEEEACTAGPAAVAEQAAVAGEDCPDAAAVPAQSQDDCRGLAEADSAAGLASAAARSADNADQAAGIPAFPAADWAVEQTVEWADPAADCSAEEQAAAVADSWVGQAGLAGPVADCRDVPEGDRSGDRRDRHWDDHRWGDRGRAGLPGPG